jgi:type VI secretion system protein ImpC
MSSAEPTPSEQPQAAQATTQEAADTGASLLKDILKAGRARSDEERVIYSDMIGQLVEDIMQGQMKVSANTEAMLNARIDEIDRLLSDQLNAIIHEEDFQKLEASWRGLHYVVHESETGDMLQVRVLNVSKKDLLRDMERAPEFDMSGLFKKVYEAEFGVFGGTPYGALIGDFEFGKHPQDLSLLKRISQVAAAAHAPFISAADAAIFGMDSYTEMTDVRALNEIFRTREYDKWRSFRESEDSRYVGLCMPHVLMRLPYGPETVPVDAFNFKEDVDGTEHNKYLWGNAAYAMGARITDAFARWGWCASIRGVENGGLVRDLPVHTFLTDDGEIAAKCPAEILITDRREKELADLGFMALTHCKNTDFAAFFSAQSCQKPFEYDKDNATANARLSTQLPYILMCSRFAHYLKAIARDKIGSLMERADCERWLNTWIRNYVTEDDRASADTRRVYPLRDARVDVEDDPRRPGCYRAVAYLRPHYQLDELTVSLRLVTELPARAQK